MDDVDGSVSSDINVYVHPLWAEPEASSVSIVPAGYEENPEDDGPPQNYIPSISVPYCIVDAVPGVRRFTADYAMLAGDRTSFLDWLLEDSSLIYVLAEEEGYLPEARAQLVELVRDAHAAEQDSQEQTLRTFVSV